MCVYAYASLNMYLLLQWYHAMIMLEQNYTNFLKMYSCINSAKHAVVLFNLWANFYVLQIDCDKTFMVTLKHDDKLQDGSECAFQVLEKFATLLYPG